MATPSKTPGEYDMKPHEETWNLFITLTKWVIGGTVVLLIFMALFLTGGSATH
jgi:Bacterial aa3 type cytochrome c oxidase subunit IV